MNQKPCVMNTSRYRHLLIILQWGGGGVKSDPFRSDSTETPLIQGANLLNLGVTFPNLLKPSSIMATPLAGDATDRKKTFKEN